MEWKQSVMCAVQEYRVKFLSPAVENIDALICTEFQAFMFDDVKGTAHFNLNDNV